MLLNTLSLFYHGIQKRGSAERNKKEKKRNYELRNARQMRSGVKGASRTHTPVAL